MVTQSQSGLPGYVVDYCAPLRPFLLWVPLSGHSPDVFRDQAMPQYCLVSLHTPLVARDLAFILEDLTGCTAIIALKGRESSCHALAEVPEGALRYAFVQSDAAMLQDTPLARRIVELGGRIVLVGSMAEGEAGHGRGDAAWRVLVQPFGPVQVAELLASLDPH